MTLPMQTPLYLSNDTTFRQFQSSIVFIDIASFVEQGGISDCSTLSKRNLMIAIVMVIGCRLVDKNGLVRLSSLSSSL
jgi:hypothetical protein